MRKAPVALAALVLAGCATTTTVLTARMMALGTEPFWSVEIGPEPLSPLRYSTPENQPGTAIPASRSLAPPATVWTGTYAGAPFVLRVAPGTCSDGMSDTVYAWQATLTVSGRTERGCAKPR